jgi:hypothetical protein
MISFLSMGMGMGKPAARARVQKDDYGGGARVRAIGSAVGGGESARSDQIWKEGAGMEMHGK